MHLYIKHLRLIIVRRIYSFFHKISSVAKFHLLKVWIFKESYLNLHSEL